MIKITLLSGPHAGQICTIPEAVKAQDMISSLAQHGWEFSVNYSQATEQEKFEWGRQELGYRAAVALSSGRKLRFLGQDYSDIGAFEDAIVTSGRMVYIARNDEEVFEVGAEGWEQ